VGGGDEGETPTAGGVRPPPMISVFGKVELIIFGVSVDPAIYFRSKRCRT